MQNLLFLFFWYRSTTPKTDSSRKWQSEQSLLETYLKLYLFSCCLWYKIMWGINNSISPLQQSSQSVFIVLAYTSAQQRSLRGAGLQKATMATQPRVAEELNTHMMRGMTKTLCSSALLGHAGLLQNSAAIQVHTKNFFLKVLLPSSYWVLNSCTHFTFSINCLLLSLVSCGVETCSET